MSETKFLKCSCTACGGRIEYPADAAGTTVECPHCRFPTDLLVEVPEGSEQPQPQRRSWLIWALIVLVLLGVAGAVAPLLLKRALARKQTSPAPSAAVLPPKTTTGHGGQVINDFDVGPVTIDRSRGPSLVYAMGTVRNTLPKQRFAVRVEIALVDGSGRDAGSTSDYAAVIEPTGTWQFKALVLKGSAASARVTQIREQ